MGRVQMKIGYFSHFENIVMSRLILSDTASNLFSMRKILVWRSRTRVLEYQGDGREGEGVNGLKLFIPK